MATTIGKTLLPEFRDQFRGVLDRARALGVDWRGTRLEAYLVQLNEAAAWKFGPGHPPEPHPVFYEAYSQAQQLIRSAEAWSDLDTRILREKLRVISDRRCRAEAPESDKPDIPRDTLLELWAAAMFRRYGFKPSLTKGKADVELLDIEGRLGRPVFVECKRPHPPTVVPPADQGEQNEKTFHNSLSKAADQLFKRQSARPNSYGIALMGLDVLTGLSKGRITPPSVAHFEQDVQRLLEVWTGKLRDANRPAPHAPISPVAILGAVALIGAVFPRAEGMPFTVERLGLRRPAAGDDALDGELERRFDAPTVPNVDPGSAAESNRS